LAGDGCTLTTAHGMRGSLTVGTTNGTHSNATTMLGVALHGLTLTGTTSAETLNGDLFASGVQVGGDSGEVGEGSVHRLPVFDSYKIHQNGDLCRNGGRSPRCLLKHHARLKGHRLPGTGGGVVLTAEPLTRLLENSLTLYGMDRADGIQAGLSGDGLPTTIEQLNKVLTDAGDEIAMEEDLRLSRVVKGHSGVRQGPGGVVGDGGVHQGFDLTHGWFVWYGSIVRGRRGSLCQAVTVYPLSL